MDIIERRAAGAVLADLANTGGGTYQQGTFLPFRPDNGFAVSLQGGLKLPWETVTPSMVMWAMRQVSREYPSASYVGTWLDNGVVYIDPVAYFGPERREAAIKAGRAHDQLAIYDFGAKEAITL